MTFVGLTALSVEMRIKALRAEVIRCLRDVVRAEDVILDRLKRRRLHERHVLMRRRVAHEIRPVTVKDLHDALTVAHGADEHDQIQLRMRAPQLHLDVVGVILVDIEMMSRFGRCAAA